MACPRAKSQRWLAFAIGGMDGQFVVVAMATIIQDPLHLLYLVEVLIFPGHVAQGPVVTLYVGLIGRAPLSTDEVLDS